MITFWVISILMVAVGMYFVLRPLLMNLDKRDIDRTVLNTDIAKERLNEIKIDLEQGIINQKQYDQTREELEQSLIFDVSQDENGNSKVGSVGSNRRVSQIALMICVPVIAIGLYALKGSPELMDGGTKQAAASTAGHASGGQAGLATVEDMIGKLAAKLKSDPDNAEGWYMLGRSYMSLKRFPEAAAALARTNQLVPNNPVIMLRYADALTMSSGGKISGEPFELVKRAVALKPDDPTGLWLIGMGYEQLGEYKKAISYWTLLIPILKDDKSVSEVKILISQAQNAAGMSPVEISAAAPMPMKKMSKVSLTVKVSINKDMLKNVSMTDTVFIFAKAVNGPPMPLAVVRKQVKDLPISVVLDDSMAMIPTMKLSSFESVKIIARVSKTGNPLPQPGDITSKAIQISLPFSETIELKINTIN